MYRKIGRELSRDESHMFGKPCFKIDGKAFISFFENSIVCKLTGDDHKEALELSGAVLFDPSKKGRPMKEWVQIPFVHSSKWKRFASAAMQYVESQNI